MVLSLPDKSAVLLHEHISVQELPARSSSVLFAIFLGAFYLPLATTLFVLTGYVLIELYGIHTLRKIEEEMTWPLYLTLLAQAFVGASVFLVIPYEMWQLDGYTPKLFGFCVLLASLIHCATVRTYHLPLAIATAAPILVVFCTSVLATTVTQDSLKDVLVGAGVLIIMAFYVALMIYDGAKSRAALIASRDAADSASVAKSRFLAAMSHEIRTPLNGILGIANLMKEDAETPSDQERVAVLVSSTEALKTLVDDVLHHAKLEAGKIKLTPVEADLSAVVRSVVNLFKTNAEEKNLTICLDIAADMPDHMIFDPIRLRQVLANLLSNAIKFTDDGGIVVSVLLDQTKDETHRVSISVADTGIGIPKESQPHLFRSFNQVDEKAERAIEGTGLGLAICKSITALMEGEIELVSSPGMGATFTVTFTAQHARAAAKASSQGAGSLGLEDAKILLVDDNKTNRFIICAYLKNTQARIDEAENGQIAVDRAAETRYDVILMDMHMPVLDGEQAFRKIREGGASCESPVVALTANSSPEDRNSYLSLGMNGYLAKPVSKEELQAEILEQMSAQAAMRTAAE